LPENGFEELAVGPDLDEVLGGVDIDDLTSAVFADGEDLPVDADDALEATRRLTHWPWPWLRALGSVMSGGRVSGFAGGGG